MGRSRREDRRNRTLGPVRHPLGQRKGKTEAKSSSGRRERTVRSKVASRLESRNIENIPKYRGDTGSDGEENSFALFKQLFTTHVIGDLAHLPSDEKTKFLLSTIGGPVQ